MEQKNLKKSHGIGGVAVGVMLLFLLTPSRAYTSVSGFKTIDDVMADAKSKNELADPENYKDHRKPSWKSYYEKTTPGFFGGFLSSIGVSKQPSWSPEYFKYLLEKRIAEREEMGKSSSHEYVHRIVPTKESRFIVWGDLTGAYHSLARGLEKLTKLGILDKNLKLQSKNDYILFMGDAAARSPFIMELLTLIMTLEDRNPDRIIYITGNNERRGSWYEYGLREALTYKASHLSSKEKPLWKTVEKYFETLPLAVYASVPPHGTNEFVRFSHFSMETPSKESYRPFVELLDDAYYSKALIDGREVGKSKYIELSENRGAPDPTAVNVRSTIKSYRKTREYQKNEGLRLLAPDKNATAWTVLSSPTVFVHKVLDFWYDSFVILQAAPNIENWTISHYSRDMRKKEDFKKESYNVLSGENIAGGKKVVKEIAKKTPEKKPAPKKVVATPATAPARAAAPPREVTPITKPKTPGLAQKNIEKKNVPTNQMRR